jgi:hypothetical protein
LKNLGLISVPLIFTTAAIQPATASFSSVSNDNYTDDTGVDGITLFTGSEYFTVKEIEAFEITD